MAHNTFLIEFLSPITQITVYKVGIVNRRSPANGIKIRPSHTSTPIHKIIRVIKSCSKLKPKSLVYPITKVQAPPVIQVVLSPHLISPIGKYS